MTLKFLKKKILIFEDSFRKYLENLRNSELHLVKIVIFKIRINFQEIFDKVWKNVEKVLHRSKWEKLTKFRVLFRNL